jgi:hypothetical protein
MYGSHKPDSESALPSASDLPLDPSTDHPTVTLRDDRLAFPGFMDAAASCRRRRVRFRLIDQGRLPPSELEWLGEAGADIYTSDRARQNLAEFIRILQATRRGDAAAAFFHHGPFESEERPGLVPFSALREMGRSGMDLHVSNKGFARAASRLDELADDCRRGGAVFVFYHHGPLDAALEPLARQGAWLHLSNRSLSSDEDVRLFLDCVRAARRAQANIVLHVELLMSPSRLSDIFRAGTLVLFKTPPSDYRSPLRPFEDAAKAVRLDPRAYYLFADFVL